MSWFSNWLYRRQIKKHLYHLIKVIPHELLENYYTLKSVDPDRPKIDLYKDIVKAYGGASLYPNEEDSDEMVERVLNDEKLDEMTERILLETKNLCDRHNIPFCFREIAVRLITMEIVKVYQGGWKMGHAITYARNIVQETIPADL